MPLLVHHLLFVAAGSTTQSIKIVGLGKLVYGLAAIGPGIGIGLVFGHAI
jgi:F0F1-type ATP synthase membrane subunit c/vacuolar-type H+-ATPase subunit K